MTNKLTYITLTIAILLFISILPIGSAQSLDFDKGIAIKTGSKAVDLIQTADRVNDVGRSVDREEEKDNLNPYMEVIGGLMFIKMGKRGNGK